MTVAHTVRSVCDVIQQTDNKYSVRSRVIIFAVVWQWGEWMRNDRFEFVHDVDGMGGGINLG